MAVLARQKIKRRRRRSNGGALPPCGAKVKAL